MKEISSGLVRSQPPEQGEPTVAIAREGEIKTATQEIRYPSVDSCMTISLVLGDRTLVGGHFVQVPVAGQIQSEEMIREFNLAAEQKRVSALVVMGDNNWETSRFIPPELQSPSFISRPSMSQLTEALAILYDSRNAWYADVRGDLSVVLPSEGSNQPRVFANQREITQSLESPFNDFFSFEDAKDNSLIFDPSSS